ATLKYLGQRFPESLTYFFVRLSTLGCLVSHLLIHNLQNSCPTSSSFSSLLLLDFTTLTPSAPFI
ncbi:MULTISPECIES: hypothetical protein, partial [Pseudanabaena]